MFPVQNMQANRCTNTYLEENKLKLRERLSSINNTEQTLPALRNICVLLLKFVFHSGLDSNPTDAGVNCRLPPVLCTVPQAGPS